MDTQAQNNQTNTGDRKPFRGRSGGSDRPRPSFDRPKPEFDQKILAVRRVTRVVSGGRRFSFAIALALGDKKGSVGVGTGKAGDTALAIQKAVKNAKKSMITLKTTKGFSIPYEVKAKFSSSRVMIMPNKGKGLVAGSAVRDLLVLAGVKNVTAKVLSGSKNKLNTARAAMKALSEIATKRSSAVIPAPAPAPAITAPTD
ncbi:MAG: 30S ribosomal protein S5 [Candidatus Paceibacterota bacterium]|jgi:small subunit ribosomal protein S5